VRDRASADIVDGLFATVSTGRRRSLAVARRDAEKAIKGAASSLALLAPLADAREQLDGARASPGSSAITGVSAAPPACPLYLAGVTHRVDQVLRRTWAATGCGWREVQAATALYVKAGGTLPLTRELTDDPSRAELVRVRWMLEELRISLFAQHLGTTGPVSVQRIQKALAR
jgi:ATP-dependent helicase HrpA